MTFYTVLTMVVMLTVSLYYIWKVNSANRDIVLKTVKLGKDSKQTYIDKVIEEVVLKGHTAEYVGTVKKYLGSDLFLIDGERFVLIYYHTRTFGSERRFGVLTAEKDYVKRNKNRLLRE